MNNHVLFRVRFFGTSIVIAFVILDLFMNTFLMMSEAGIGLENDATFTFKGMDFFPMNLQ